MRASLISRALALCAVILSYQAGLGRPQVFGGECDAYMEDCLMAYNDIALQLGDLDSSVSCPIIQDAIDCLSEGDCASDFFVSLRREHVVEDQSVHCPEECDTQACLEQYNIIQMQLSEMGSEVVCPVIEEAIECLNTEACADNILASFLRAALEDNYNEYCYNVSTPSTPSPTPSPSPSPAPSPTPPCPPPDAIPDTLPCNPVLEDCCPLLPDTTCNPVRAVESASVQSLPSGNLQHCSVFSYSHVRPWGAYGSRIDTCSLPGSWFLVKHSSFSIEIEASAESANSPYTKLDKVNITFHDPRRTYIAESSATLPLNFSDDPDPSLSLVVNGSVATIASNLLNVTVIIRRYANHLSVTVQVPGIMILTTDGLCNGGCPHHTYHNITEFISKFANPETSECFSDYNTATYHCFTYIGNGRIFGLTNSTYTEVCQFDMLWEKNLRMVTVINATVRDALLLPNMGPAPFLQGPTIPDDVINTVTPQPTSDDTPTPDVGGTNSPQGTSSALPLAPLHIAPLLLTLVVGVLAQR